MRNSELRKQRDNAKARDLKEFTGGNIYVDAKGNLVINTRDQQTLTIAPSVARSMIPTLMEFLPERELPFPEEFLLKLNTSIHFLGLSRRLQSLLYWENLRTVEELFHRSEEQLRRIPNFGNLAWIELLKALSDLCESFGLDYTTVVNTLKERSKKEK